MSFCHYLKKKAITRCFWLCALDGQVLRLTQTRRAGIGVQRLTWIMASKLGKCPSRAPEKHSLGTGRAMDKPEPGVGASLWLARTQLSPLPSALQALPALLM